MRFDPLHSEEDFVRRRWMLQLGIWGGYGTIYSRRHLHMLIVIFTFLPLRFIRNWAPLRVVWPMQMGSNWMKLRIRLVGCCITTRSVRVGIQCSRRFICLWREYYLSFSLSICPCSSLRLPWGVWNFVWHVFFSLSRQYCRDDLAISRAVERFYDEMDSGHSDTGNNKMKVTPDDWVATELSAAMWVNSTSISFNLSRARLILPFLPPLLLLAIMPPHLAGAIAG